MFVFVLFEKNTENKVCVRERHFHWWARDREVARIPESGCRALLPCPMAHARRHSRAVSCVRATAARTPKSFPALSTERFMDIYMGRERARRGNRSLYIPHIRLHVRSYESCGEPSVGPRVGCGERPEPTPRSVESGKVRLNATRAFWPKTSEEKEKPSREAWPRRAQPAEGMAACRVALRARPLVS